MSCSSHFRLLLAVIFFSALQLSPCQDVTAKKNDEPKTYKLEGTVVNAVTGEPLRRALVELTSPSWPPVLTGSDGKFVFENLPDEEWTLQVIKPGFFPREGENTNLFQVRPGDPPLTVHMVPEAVVTGHVEDRNGEPVERALARVMAANFTMGRMDYAQVGQAITDEDGNFRIANLHARRCWVLVQPNQVSVRTFANDVQGIKDGFPAIVYYPAARELTSATPIQLLPGRESEVRFVLPSEPIFQISGTVIGANPGQVPDVRLLTTSGDNLAVPKRLNQQTGGFEIRMVPAGTYMLESTSWDAERHLLTAEVPITVQANVTDVALTLVQGKTVPVVVHTDLSGPMQGLRNTADLGRSIRIGMRFLSPFNKQDRGMQYYSTEDMRLAPGKYAFEGISADFLYVESARSGSVDLLREPLVVPREGDVPPIELILRDDGGSITGNLHGAKLPAGVVVAVPERSSMQSPKQDMVQGAATRFNFQNLAPGDYRLYAFDTTAQFEYSNPAVLADYSSKGVHVTITPKSRVEVDVEVMHVGE